MYTGISKIDGISCRKPQAGAFIFLNISKLGASDEGFCHYLLSQYGIPGTPGRCFQSEDHLRLPFGATEEILGRVLKDLKVAVEDQRKP